MYSTVPPCLQLLKKLPLVASVTGGPGTPCFGARLGSGKFCNRWRSLFQPVKGPLWAGFAGSYLRLSLFLTQYNTFFSSCQITRRTKFFCFFGPFLSFFHLDTNNFFFVILCEPFCNFSQHIVGFFYKKTAYIVDFDIFRLFSILLKSCRNTTFFAYLLTFFIFLL